MIVFCYTVIKIYVKKKKKDKKSAPSIEFHDSLDISRHDTPISNVIGCCMRAGHALGNLIELLAAMIFFLGSILIAVLPEVCIFSPFKKKFFCLCIQKSAGDHLKVTPMRTRATTVSTSCSWRQDMWHQGMLRPPYAQPILWPSHLRACIDSRPWPHRLMAFNCRTSSSSTQSPDKKK